MGGVVLLVLFFVAFYMWILISERLYFYKYSLDDAIEKSFMDYKKLTGKDISDYDSHIQFVDTHGVDGDSASITLATAIISALENILLPGLDTLSKVLITGFPE